MKEFTLRVVTDNSTLMTLTLAETGNGVRLEQGFDGIWNAEGLRKAAAVLKVRRRCGGVGAGRGILDRRS